jgi:hypothetical protein
MRPSTSGTIVGQVGNLRGGWLPPPVRCDSGCWPIDNRPQLTKLPHNVSPNLAPAERARR